MKHAAVPAWPRWHLSLAVFTMALAIRLVCLGQPLVENFIDRQVHTAMMARSIARGGSVLYPQIDIGPFPAYYMLEFPAYPWLVGTLASTLEIPLDVTGRMVSAVAMAIACLLLFDLMRRRDGPAVGLLAAFFFAMMPVTIRFGRAFQPDSLMIASLVSAVWCMDRWRETGRHTALTLAALATGLALLLKVISAYILLPIAYLAWSRYGWSFLRRAQLWLALVIAVLPALVWYVHAWHVAANFATVSTPFWHIHKWFALERLFDQATYHQLAYFVGLRVLTPVGVLLAVAGSLVCAGPVTSTGRGGMLIHVWLGSLVAYLPILLRKLDHEHYYLALAPVAAVLIGRALVALATAPLADRCYASGRVVAVTLGIALFASDVLVCRSTFRDPAEWRHVAEAAAATRVCTPAGALVAAHSSVLFYADRRGFTFAYAPDEIEYLFGTWSEPIKEPTPQQLLEFYRGQGADYFVELLGTNRERDNTAFFEYVRTHYELVRVVPGKYLVASLRNGQNR